MTSRSLKTKVKKLHKTYKDQTKVLKINIVTVFGEPGRPSEHDPQMLVNEIHLYPRSGKTIDKGLKIIDKPPEMLSQAPLKQDINHTAQIDQIDQNKQQHTQHTQHDNRHDPRQPDQQHPYNKFYNPHAIAPPDKERDRCLLYNAKITVQDNIHNAANRPKVIRSRRML